MTIRPALPADFDAMWPIFQAVVSAGTTYVFAPDTTPEEAFAYWFGAGIQSFVAEDAGRIVGMYKLIANYPGLGSHVANASFMVDPQRLGRGAGKAMGLHCLQQARRTGFLAIQFNFVVSTNAAAVALWERLGFSIVGRLPAVYRHAELGLVDAYVMHRFLDDVEVPGSPDSE
jgi:L-amino acid N-acyltransferase YncA